VDLTDWVPLNDLDRLLNRYYSLPSRLDKQFPGLHFFDTGMSWRPAAAISETGAEYLIKADLSEVERREIDIELINNTNTLEVEREIEYASDNEKRHRVESFYGSFERHFALLRDVERDSISAKCAKGVLEIHLPKREAAAGDTQSRKIESQ